MKIRPVGASGGEVTGSAYVVRTKRATILVDAGMFQGGRQSEAKNKLPSGVPLNELNASVHTLNGFSGHADQSELLKWFSTLAPGKPKVFLTHGEDRGRGALANQIQQRFKLTAGLPRQGEAIEI